MKKTISYKVTLEQLNMNFTDKSAYDLTIHKLTARNLIQDAATNKDEAIFYSKKYSILCSYTSFVGIETRTDGTVGNMITRKIPVALGKDSIPAFLNYAPVSHARGFSLSTPGRLGGNAFIGGGPVTRSLRPTATSLSTSTNKLDELIGLQKANGSWPVNSQVVNLLGIIKDRLEKVIPQLLLTGTQDEQLVIWYTAVVIAYLESKFYKEKDQWFMLASKATKFIQKEKDKLKFQVDVIVEAQNFISTQKL